MPPDLGRQSGKASCRREVHPDISAVLGQVWQTDHIHHSFGWCQLTPTPRRGAPGYVGYLLIPISQASEATSSFLHNWFSDIHFLSIGVLQHGAPILSSQESEGAPTF